MHILVIGKKFIIWSERKGNSYELFGMGDNTYNQLSPSPQKIFPIPIRLSDKLKDGLVSMCAGAYQTYGLQQDMTYKLIGHIISFY